ncbi:hypothetical protein ACFYTC_29445 [Actinomadura nitritigenes]|uniref:hypothetical protein n=1 Tax=Actinomadura nitritigenes TaxID=134602 RepID=UPI0036BF6F04
MRKITAAAAALALSGTLALGTLPAEAAPKPKAPAAQLPAQLQTQVELGFVGWDDKGPYVVWGNMSCHIHLLAPEEWSWAWGSGPCWF